MAIDPGAAFSAFSEAVWRQLMSENQTLERDLEIALWQTDPDRWGHLHIVVWNDLRVEYHIPRTVACSWPDPVPVEAL